MYAHRIQGDPLQTRFAYLWSPPDIRQPHQKSQEHQGRYARLSIPERNLRSESAVLKRYRQSHAEAGDKGDESRDYKHQKASLYELSLIHI